MSDPGREVQYWGPVEASYLASYLPREGTCLCRLATDGTAERGIKSTQNSHGGSEWKGEKE